MARYIGKDLSRVDGVAKVTGRAKYAAEFKVPNLAYGFLVMSEIAKGTIKSIDTSEATRAPANSYRKFFWSVIKRIVEVSKPR